MTEEQEKEVEFRCAEFEGSRKLCEAHDSPTQCEGKLCNCGFFDVHVNSKMGACGLTVPGSEKGKETVVAVFYLGDGFARQGFLNEAIDWYERALKCNPAKEQLKAAIEDLKKRKST